MGVFPWFCGFPPVFQPLFLSPLVAWQLFPSTRHNGCAVKGQRLKLPLQIHPVPSGRLIWVKYVKSWKSLHILLNAHIHLEQIAVPLVPCKSLRNAAEVWDLPQRDLESLWTEKWRICLTFINLTVLIYFYREIVSHTSINKTVQLERILHEPASPISPGCIQYLKVFAI